MLCDKSAEETTRSSFDVAAFAGGDSPLTQANHLCLHLTGLYLALDVHTTIGEIICSGTRNRFREDAHACGNKTEEVGQTHFGKTAGLEMVTGWSRDKWNDGAQSSSSNRKEGVAWAGCSAGKMCPDRVCLPNLSIVQEAGQCQVMRFLRNHFHTLKNLLVNFATIDPHESPPAIETRPVGKAEVQGAGETSTGDVHIVSSFEMIQSSSGLWNSTKRGALCFASMAGLKSVISHSPDVAGAKC